MFTLEEESGENVDCVANMNRKERKMKSPEMLKTFNLDLFA